MRYEGTRPSGKDKNIDVRIFSVGKAELNILYGLVSTANQNTPMTPESHDYKSRLRNMAKILLGVMQGEDRNNSKTKKTEETRKCSCGIHKELDKDDNHSFDECPYHRRKGKYP